MSNEHEDQDMNQEGHDEISRAERFDRFMFGSRSRRSNYEDPEENAQANQKDGVDFNQFMGQLDDIMTSIDKIKPALKELSPLLGYFRKK